MSDDGIREIHAVGKSHRTAGSNWPRLLCEQDDSVRFIFGGGFEPKFMMLSSEDARALARKLNRLALRIERRLDGKQP